MAVPARRFQRRLPARWDPFADLEDVYERMGRLLENGVLTVRLPKAPQAQARKIPITGG